MSFELNHASSKNYMVPNNTQISVKLRGEEDLLEAWTYRGLDDDRLFMLLSKGDNMRWIPIAAISYIEQLQSA